MCLIIYTKLVTNTTSKTYCCKLATIAKMTHDRRIIKWLRNRQMWLLFAENTYMPNRVSCVTMFVSFGQKYLAIYLYFVFKDTVTYG